LAYGEVTQFAALFLAVKGVEEVDDEKKSGTSFSGLFSNSIFRDIVISLAATIGLYVISSVVHVRGLSF
jgi:chitin synthase